MREPAGRLLVRRACLAGWLVAMLGAAALAHLGAAPSSVALALTFAFIPYAPLALFWLRSRPTRASRPNASRSEGSIAESALPSSLGGAARGPFGLGPSFGVGVMATLAALPFLFAPGALSDDVYRFLWDAKVSGAGLDPYAFAPSDAALASLRDASWANINHPDIPTVYPAGAQLLFLVGRAFTDGPLGPRLLALLGHLAVTYVLARRGPAGSDVAWALNPLALSESALGGHVDVFVGLALLGAGFALAERRLPRAAVFALGAAAVKLVGFLALPFVARDWRALAVGLGLAALLALPLTRAGDGSGVPGGFGNYARRWAGNAGVHALLASGVEEGLLAVAGDPEGRVKVERLRPLLTRLAGGPLDPRASFTVAKKPVHDLAVFEAHVAASLVTRALVLVVALLLAISLARRARRGLDPRVALRALVLAVLVLAPQMHPWYLLWVLPLELAARDVGGGPRLAATVWSVWVLGAYAPLDAWVEEGVWAEPPGFGLVAQVVVIALLIVELRGGVEDRPSASRVRVAPTPSSVPRGGVEDRPSASRVRVAPTP